MPTFPSPCANCKNYLGGRTCQAFSRTIPKEIIEGDNPHTKPTEKQENDVVYEPIE